MTLFPIRDYLTYLTESFAALLDLEFTIINASPMRRVTGTGYYRTIGESGGLWKPSYTKMVIESGEPMFALDTSAYRATMPDRTAYTEHYSLILHPIRCQGEVVGVIVIASFNAQQQGQLLGKRMRLMEYLGCIAELIELKLTQDRDHARMLLERNQLELIYENISNGVILFTNGKVTRMNALAHKLMFDEDPQLYALYLQDVRDIARSADEAHEVRRGQLYHTYEGKSTILTVRAVPLNNRDRNVICLIMPFIETQESFFPSGESAITEGEMIAKNREMVSLIQNVRIVARNDSNVLVTGESGTGKEMIARIIHNSSRRRDKPFVSINCAAIPEALLESELFGYEQGAFTGANRGGKIGKFMLADSGTLFLDEIGDMPLYLQAKLLRAISERKIDRVGGAQPIDVDVRIIAATNRDLEKMIREQTFREDLFYRLSVIPFTIPPLRERREDIVPLTNYFISKYNGKLEKRITGTSNAVMKVFLAYDWPGNVRELENSIEYMMNFERSPILTDASLPPRLKRRADAQEDRPSGLAAAQEHGSLKERLARYERALFCGFSEANGGKPLLAKIDAFCRELEISRATYYRKLAEATRAAAGIASADSQI